MWVFTTVITVVIKVEFKKLDLQSREGEKEWKRQEKKEETLSKKGGPKTWRISPTRVKFLSWRREKNCKSIIEAEIMLQEVEIWSLKEVDLDWLCWIKLTWNSLCWWVDLVDGGRLVVGLEVLGVSLWIDSWRRREFWLGFP